MSFAKKSQILLALAAAGWVQVSQGQDTTNAFQVTARQDTRSVPALPHPEPAVGSPRSVASESGPKPSPGCYFLNARSFSIPFTVDAAGAQPREVQLFTSRGPSAPWKRVAGKPASVELKEFQFEGAEDGEFWFATRTIDSSGHAHPAGPIRPQLKVFVDTNKPSIDVNADADADGTVEALIAVDDSTPLTVQVRYATDSARTWHDLKRKLPENGKLSFRPEESWEQMSLQVIVTDAAKNRSIVSKLINRPRLAELPGSRYAGNRSETDARPAQYRLGEQATTMPVATGQTVAPNQNAIAQGRSVPAAGTPGTHPGYVHDPSRFSAMGAYRGAHITPTNPAHAAAPTRPRVPVQTRPVASPASSGSLLNAGVNRFAENEVSLPPPATPAQISRGFFDNGQQPSPSGPSPSGPSPGGPSPGGQTLVQESVPTPNGQPDTTNGFGLSGPSQSVPMPETKAGETTAPPRRRPQTAAEAFRPLTPTRPVPENVESIPSPVGEADPEAKKPTQRSARKPVAIDPSSRAPVRFSDSVRFSLDFEVEAIGSAGVDAIELYGSDDGGKNWKFWGADPDRVSPFDIETKEEGAFGFRIVVIGKNGLTSPRPLPGESPDIIVVVDQVNPVVRISGAQYGEGDRVGSLVIQYECEDANLKSRPITLAFSDSMEGPWTTIAAGLRNDGSYVWPADPGLPRQIYLRIDATDESGNVGTYILDRPIDVQGLAPRARIRGFQPLSGMAPRSDQKTARAPGNHVK